MRFLKKRGFLQISFAWLFGIIAGAIILALAIFLATRLTHSGQYQTSAEAQSQINVLLNPLESGVQSGQVTTLNIASPTRIYNICDNESGIFGKQSLSLSQESFGRWSVPTQSISSQNRYIFSGNVTEGKDFVLFSKPFDFPFKVADLIYLTSSSANYCFANPPSEVYTELSNLNQQNIDPVSSPSLCPAGFVQVCFIGNGITCNSGNENVTVNYDAGTVEKNGETMSFSNDALMYAAIFSDKTIYDCQLKRLMNREAELTDIYIGKSELVQSQGCDAGFVPDLSELKKESGSFGSESDLTGILQLTNKIKQENEVASCPLW